MPASLAWRRPKCRCECLSHTERCAAGKSCVTVVPLLHKVIQVGILALVHSVDDLGPIDDGNFNLGGSAVDLLGHVARNGLEIGILRRLPLREVVSGREATDGKGHSCLGQLERRRHDVHVVPAPGRSIDGLEIGLAEGVGKPPVGDEPARRVPVERMRHDFIVMAHVSNQVRISCFDSADLFVRVFAVRHHLQVGRGKGALHRVRATKGRPLEECM